MNEKKKLEKILKENPDPSKWSKWLKIIIKCLLLILSAVCGDAVDFTSVLSNLL